MKPRVTQRDVARKAEVSHVTVSLALRGDPSIPEKTRTRIEKIAKLIGYTPDPMLSALSSYRRQNRPAAYHANIAWLLSDPQAGKGGSGDFHLYYKGAEARAKQLGYVLDEINLLGQPTDYKWLRRLLDARNITGLILAPAMSSSNDLNVGREFEFEMSRYSGVRLGYSFRQPLLNTVANSQFRTVLTAMQKVVALGYRRVGILLTEEVDERTSWHFLGGFHAGQHLLPKENWIAPCYVTPGYDPAVAAYDWIVKEKLDCFIGAGYRFIYSDLLKRGLDIPGKVGYADIHLEEGDTFFSGIHQNTRQVGVAAVDLLVSMMHRDDTGIPVHPSHLLIEGSWHEGQTLSKRSAKSAL